MKRKKRLIIYCLLFLLISSVIFFLGSRFRQDEIIRFVQNAGVWAPIVYVLLMVASYVLAPLSGTPIFFAGYALFKDSFNFYVYIAHLISAVINFGIARRWGRGLVARLAGPKNLNKIDRFTGDYGIKSLIFLRLTLSLFHDFVSYAYGLTNIRFWPYFLVSALGYLPWFFLWQFYLHQVINNFGDFTILFVASLVPLWLIAIFLGLKFKKKEGHLS